MRNDIVTRMSVWLVQRCLPGSAGEAFAGDLLEMSANVRSFWWCSGEALQLVGAAAELRLRALLLPLWFCIAFVLLHPLWQWLYLPSAARLLLKYRDKIVWPGSAVLEIVTGLLPAVLFIWIGVFLFLLLRRASFVRVLLSLSTGCCVVSAETVLRLGALKHNLRLLPGRDFYYPALHFHFSLLLFVGLFAAIVLLSREPCQSDRGRYARRLPGPRHLLRFVRGLWPMTLLIPIVSLQTRERHRLAAKRLV